MSMGAHKKTSVAPRYDRKIFTEKPKTPAGDFSKPGPKPSQTSRGQSGARGGAPTPPKQNPQNPKAQPKAKPKAKPKVWDEALLRQIKSCLQKLSREDRLKAIREDFSQRQRLLFEKWMALPEVQSQTPACKRRKLSAVRKVISHNEQRLVVFLGKEYRNNKKSDTDLGCYGQVQNGVVVALPDTENTWHWQEIINWWGWATTSWHLI